MGQVVYYVALSDTIDDDRNQEVPKDLKKMCTNFGLCMYFLLTAAWFWLTAVCVNMALGFKLQVFPSSRSGRKRFVLFSAFAWGIPALLTIVYSYQFTPMEFGYVQLEAIPWYRPQLMEARVCYTETVFVTVDKDHKQQIFTLRYGTAIFYYVPMGCLVLCNCICLLHALRKMQKLRRGNSILRKDERRAPGHHHARRNTRPTANSENPNGITSKARNGGSSQTAIDAKTIKVYIKMILMTGGIEIFSEVIVWAGTKYSSDSTYESNDYNYPYRASGYVTDFFRALCVTWLAAPEGGYLALVRKGMHIEKK